MNGEATGYFKVNDVLVPGSFVEADESKDHFLNLFVHNICLSIWLSVID